MADANHPDAPNDWIQWAPTRRYDEAVYDAVDQRVLTTLDECRESIFALQQLFWKTTARKAIDCLMNAGSTVLTTSLLYLKHREQNKPGYLPTRTTLIAVAETVNKLRVPPLLREHRDEIKALQARLVELANSLPE